MVMVIFDILFGILKILFIAVLFSSPMLYVGYKNYKKSYAFNSSGIEITGVVTRIRTVTEYSSQLYKKVSSTNDRSHPYHLYFPVVAFEYNGEKYECDSCMPMPEHICPFPGTEVKIIVEEGFKRVKIIK